MVEREDEDHGHDGEEQLEDRRVGLLARELSRGADGRRGGERAHHVGEERESGREDEREDAPGERGRRERHAQLGPGASTPREPDVEAAVERRGERDERDHGSGAHERAVIEGEARERSPAGREEVDPAHARHVEEEREGRLEEERGLDGLPADREREEPGQDDEDRERER